MLITTLQLCHVNDVTEVQGGGHQHGPQHSNHAHSTLLSQCGYSLLNRAIEDPQAPLLVSPHMPTVSEDLVGRIWQREFIEMADLLPGSLRTGGILQPLRRRRRGRRRKRQSHPASNGWSVLPYMLHLWW